MIKKIITTLPILLLLSGCAGMIGANPEFTTSKYIQPDDSGTKILKLVTLITEGEQNSSGSSQLSRFSKLLNEELQALEVRSDLVEIVVNDTTISDLNSEIKTEREDKYVLWLNWSRYRVDDFNGGLLTVHFNVTDIQSNEIIWTSRAIVNVSLGLRKTAVRKVIEEFASRKIISLSLN